jgi:TRAP-type transport system periplasmic protein
VRHKTSFPGGLYNTSFAFVMNEGAWKKISKADQDAITKLSGEYAARMFGRGWDQVDRRGNAFMQAAGVQPVMANKAFVDEIRTRTKGLEERWVGEAKSRGLTNADQVLREFRAEIGKI